MTDHNLYPLTDEQCDEFRRMPLSFNDMVRAIYAAGIERAAQHIEPKNKRPCDCDRCDCGNSGDMIAVSNWDAMQSLATEIRSLSSQEPK